MRIGLSIATVLALAVGSTAYAGQYTKSIEGCENAIGQRLGIADVSTNYNVGKIKTQGRNRDMAFSVSAYDKTNPVQGVAVNCRVTRGGEVLALEFDETALPTTVATQ